MYLRALKQIFRISFTIMLLITLPAVVFTLISSKTSVFGIKSFVVLTGSMEPNIPVGSVLYTMELPTYQAGDVIAFKQGNLTISHRIVKVTPLGYQTKGDANNAVDSNIVSQKDVQGVQIYRLLNLGKLILLLKTIPGFVIFIVGPSLLLIMFEVWSIKKEMEKEITKKLLRQLSNGFKLSNG